MQARIEAIGQVLMWKAVEAGPGLQRLGRRSRRPARAGSDRYEEHMLLPDDRVALMTNQRLMLVSAPGFAKVGPAAPLTGCRKPKERITCLSGLQGHRTGLFHLLDVPDAKPWSWLGVCEAPFHFDCVQVHAAAEEGVQIGSGDDIPAGQIKWSVEWQACFNKPSACNTH